MINISLGSFPGRGYTDALLMAMSQMNEPLWGKLNIDHVQICPQNSGRLTVDIIKELQDISPESKFRLHANVHVMDKHSPTLSLASLWKYKKEFKKLAELSKLLNAPCYTLHAGVKVLNLKDARLRRSLSILEDMFECPVGVEGHYPTPPVNKFHLSTWDDHQKMYDDTDMKFVIDLSHFNIIKTRDGMTSDNLSLLSAMLESPRCLEIHVSGNEGSRDEHCQLRTKQWWHNLLENLNPEATIFTEGIQNKSRVKII